MNTLLALLASLMTVCFALSLARAESPAQKIAMIKVTENTFNKEGRDQNRRGRYR